MAPARLPPEGRRDHLLFVRAWRVVRVALGRCDVAVAHPFLEGAHGDVGGGHVGAEGVAEVVEAGSGVEAAALTVCCMRR